LGDIPGEISSAMWDLGDSEQVQDLVNSVLLQNIPVSDILEKG